MICSGTEIGNHVVQTRNLYMFDLKLLLCFCPTFHLHYTPSSKLKFGIVGSASRTKDIIGGNEKNNYIKYGTIGKKRIAKFRLL